MSSYNDFGSFEKFLDRENLVVSNQERYNELKALNRNFKIDAIMSEEDRLSQYFEIEVEGLSSIPSAIITDIENGQKTYFSLWEK
jgi:hypothetical protein